MSYAYYYCRGRYVPLPQIETSFYFVHEIVQGKKKVELVFVDPPYRRFTMSASKLNLFPISKV